MALNGRTRVCVIGRFHSLVKGEELDILAENAKSEREGLDPEPADVNVLRFRASTALMART
jgi:hypothetical protein